MRTGDLGAFPVVTIRFAPRVWSVAAVAVAGPALASTLLLPGALVLVVNPFPTRE